jgi:hypothetical protein
MLAFELFVWWYGQGWLTAAKNIGKALTGISRLFSIPILIRTLFAPWKRIVTYPGESLDAKLRAYGDNMVSRAVGFVVRLLVLTTALTMASLAFICGSIICILWPLVPPAAVFLIIKGIM